MYNPESFDLESELKWIGEMMEKINSTSAYYIKLGKGGEFEKDCLKNNYLKLGYCQDDHELCLSGKWMEIIEQRELRTPEVKRGAKNQVRQLRTFYEADEHTLWITFMNEKLYWCFAEKKIEKLPGNYKIRRLIGKWAHTDIFGNDLFENKLSGNLTRTKGYPQTICRINDAYDQLIKKINGEKNEVAEKANLNKADLETQIGCLIKSFPPKDFEILVELIFSRAGLQKISETGKTQKNIDILLVSPITNETFSVQVKSSANYRDYDGYRQKFDDSGYNRFFFVVHSPKKELEDKKLEHKLEDVWLTNELTKMVVKYGLVDWVIDKAC